MQKANLDVIPFIYMQILYKNANYWHIIYQTAHKLVLFKKYRECRLISVCSQQVPVQINIICLST